MAGLEGQLTDPAKARGAELPKLNPEYGNWVNGVTEEDADEMLSSERQRGPTSSTARMPVSRITARIPRFQRHPECRYADHFQHRYRRYIDLPFPNDGTRLIQPMLPNAEHRSPRSARSALSGEVLERWPSRD